MFSRFKNYLKDNWLFKTKVIIIYYSVDNISKHMEH